MSIHVGAGTPHVSIVRAARKPRPVFVNRYLPQPYVPVGLKVAFGAETVALLAVLVAWL